MRNVLTTPMPKELFLWWNIGSMLGMMLVIQIISGLFLVASFSVSDYSFDSLIHIIRDTNNGWFLRLVHCNGASMYFFFIYLHIGRALYYKSAYTNKMVYFVGILMYVVSMMIAFVGYVLPMGQMSFWGATVITNLLSAIPYVGTTLVSWIWGGFSVSTTTLSRFFTIHFIAPFFIAFLSLLHLFILHKGGSTNPLGMKTHHNKVTFYPYYFFKDSITWILVALFMFTLVYFLGYSLMDPENFIPANQLVTPTHIQPEWYFLFAYAILRAIPSKMGGVIGLISAILFLFFIPFNSKSVMYPTSTSCAQQIIIFSFFSCFLLLSWLGAQPVEEPYIVCSQTVSLFYFMFLFLL